MSRVKLKNAIAFFKYRGIWENIPREKPKKPLCRTIEELTYSVKPIHSIDRRIDIFSKGHPFSTSTLSTGQMSADYGVNMDYGVSLDHKKTSKRI